MIPPKLKSGDHVRVIAPAHSFSPKFTKEYRERAEKRLGKLGLRVSYGKHADERNDFRTTTLEHRLEDLHEAFADPDVQAVIPAMGGSSANQLLKYVDYELIKKNPKIFCGLSDITELANAVYKKTGLVTYYGPHYTSIGASRLVDHSIENMRQTFFSDAPVALQPSDYYSNSDWDKEMIVNEGFWTINEGRAEGNSIGGNLLTLNFLMGSEFMPDIADSILFVEENKIIDFRGVQKEIQSILNNFHGEKIRGLIIGRFQRQTGMSRELLSKLIKSKKELENIPVVGNVDVSHTVPMVTLPIGGSIRMEAGADDQIKIQIMKH